MVASGGNALGRTAKAQGIPRPERRHGDVGYWREPREFRVRGKRGRSIEMIADRGAGMPQTVRPMIGTIVGMLMLLLMMVMVPGMILDRLFFGGRWLLHLRAEIHDGVADMNVIITVKPMMNGRRNDRSPAVEENRPGANDRSPRGRHRCGLMRLSRRTLSVDRRKFPTFVESHGGSATPSPGRAGRRHFHPIVKRAVPLAVRTTF